MKRAFSEQLRATFNAVYIIILSRCLRSRKNVMRIVHEDDSVIRPKPEADRKPCERKMARMKEENGAKM